MQALDMSKNNSLTSRGVPATRYSRGGVEYNVMVNTRSLRNMHGGTVPTIIFAFDAKWIVREIDERTGMTHYRPATEFDPDTE